MKQNDDEKENKEIINEIRYIEKNGMVLDKSLSENQYGDKGKKEK